MIMRYEYLGQHATVFQKCTGLTVRLFDQLVNDVLPLYLEVEKAASAIPSGSAPSVRDASTNSNCAISCC